MVPPWAGTGPLRGHAHFLLPTAAPSFPPLALRMPVLRLPPPAVAGRWTPPGPESGLLSSTQKRTEEALTKQEALLRRAAAAESSRAGETRTLRHAARSLGCYGDGTGFWAVSGQSSDSESFLPAPARLSQRGCGRGGLWEAVGHVAAPFDLAHVLPLGGALLVLRSLPPLGKELTQKVTVGSGWGGWFQSVSFPRHIHLSETLRRQCYSKGCGGLPPSLLESRGLERRCCPLSPSSQPPTSSLLTESCFGGGCPALGGT